MCSCTNQFYVGAGGREKTEVVSLKNMLLSIVVPIYNVERYLPICIDSLLNQDLPVNEYEIILVDDGSPDRCAAICDEYASKYENIRVIHKENGGLSAARNSGIEVAQGKYIQFVDSDDYLEPNVLKALVEKMEADNLDVLRFDYRNVNENGEEVHPNKDPKRFVDFSIEVCNGLTFLTERLGPACYVVQFMLKTELVKSVPLFREGIRFEDVEWTPRVLTASNRVTSENKIVYNYLIRKGSITNAVTVEKKRKIADDKILLIELIKSQMADRSDKRWYEGTIAGMVISLLGTVAIDLFDERRKYIKKLRGLEVFPLSDYHLNKGGMRRRDLINLSPGLYCLLLRLKK